MKRIIIALLSVIIAAPAFAQFTTSLSVSNPSSLPEEWYNNSTFIFVVMTEGDIAIESQQVVIKADIKTTDGTVVASTNLSKAPVFTLGNGTTIFYAKDIFPSNITTFNGSYRNSINKTGKLPAGAYVVEVQLVEPGTYAAITALQTRVFNLSAPQLPRLIMPLNQDSLDAQKAATAIIFRWTPLAPKPQANVYYHLQVFEVYPYQQPLQALRGNQPLLDETLNGQTQFIWRPQMDFTTDSISKKFIWTIQTLNENQQPYVQTDGNGESRSQPFVFEVKK